MYVNLFNNIISTSFSKIMFSIKPAQNEMFISKKKITTLVVIQSIVCLLVLTLLLLTVIRGY